MTHNASSSPRKLVMRLGHLGDVVLTTGLLRYFGTDWNCRFDVLTREQWKPLFDNHPFVDKVWSASAGELRQPELCRYLRTICRNYSSEDLFIDLHGVLRSRLLGLLWPGKVVRYQKLGLERRMFMLSHGRHWSGKLRNSSVLQRYRTAFTKEYIDERALLPRLYLTEEEQLLAWERLSAVYPDTGKTALPGTAIQPVVALHPFATHQSKTWPFETWRMLADMLTQEKIPWIVTGMAPSAQAAYWNGRESFVNKTTLRELAGLLDCCQVLVTGDSGPMHVARAVQTQVVAIFGPTIKEWGFFPSAEEGVVLEAALPCRPCSLHGRDGCNRERNCLQAIQPSDVMKEIRKSIENNTRG